MISMKISVEKIDDDVIEAACENFCVLEAIKDLAHAQ
jgi:hypothetical protein